MGSVVDEVLGPFSERANKGWLRLRRLMGGSREAFHNCNYLIAAHLPAGDFNDI